MNQNAKVANLYYLNQMDKEQLQKLKKKRHQEASKFVDKFEMFATEKDAIALFKIANDLRHFGNELSHWVNNNYFQMKRIKQYRNAMKQYTKCQKKLNGLTKQKNKKEYDFWTNRLEEVKNELTEIRKRFSLTWEALRVKQKELGKTTHYAYINSIFKLTKAEDVWNGAQKVLFGNGKRLHYRQSNELPIIQSKQLGRAITHKFDKNDNLIITIGCSKTCNMKPINLELTPIKNDDLFLQDEYARLYYYLRNVKELENIAITEYIKNKKIIDIHKICYFSIKCEMIRGKKRIFLMPTVEGKPCTKKRIIKNFNGTTTITKRHHFYNGKEKRRIAFDEGTQSYAFVTSDKVELDNIGERNKKIIKTNERKEQLLSRALGRSRMINNQQNYENGKIKKGKKKWHKTKNYIRKQKEHQKLCRANALSKKYAIHELVNRSRTYANELVIEPSNFNALKKKAKVSKETEKTKEITTKDGKKITIKKKTRRKRFGKSVNRRSPGYMHSRLVSLFTSTCGTCIIVKNTVKASQYDHKLDQFIKKKLSQRFHIFIDGTKVQRDIYSAFLLYCVDEFGEKIERQRCLDFFNKFYLMFLELEDTIKKEKRQICNSGYKF